MIKCCGIDTVWVENVPGKGYAFCRECRTEAFDPSTVKLEEVEQEETVLVLQSWFRYVSPWWETQLRPIQPFLDAVDDTDEEDLDHVFPTV